MRHHTSPNMYLPYEDLEKDPYYYPPRYSAIDWKEIFLNREAPGALDIGCGRGGFLLDFAERFPEVNILGMELRKAAVDWINEIIAGEKIPNAAALWYSVANGLPFIEARSISSVFYFFPDPWPKKRHHKRRAFNEKFLDELDRILKPEGRIYLMTDVPEVNEYQRDTLERHGVFHWRYVEDDEEWGLPRTDQENFSRRKNIPYVRLICERQ